MPVVPAQMIVARLPCDLWRCTCLWVDESTRRLTMPWCEIHGEHLPAEWRRCGGLIVPATDPEPFGRATKDDVLWGINEDSLTFRVVWRPPGNAFGLMKEKMARAWDEMNIRLLWDHGGTVVEASRAELEHAGIPYVAPRRMGYVYNLGLTYADMAELKARVDTLEADHEDDLNAAF